MQNVELKAVLTGVRPGGCVQPYLMGFAAELTSAGYTLLTARDFMRSAVHLGRWMDSHNIRIGGLKQATITRFTHHKCQCPGVWRHGQCRSHLDRAVPIVPEMILIGMPARCVFAARRTRKFVCRCRRTPGMR